MRKNIINLGIFLLFSSLAFAQHSEVVDSEVAHYQNALDLFNKNQYRASQMHFKNLMKQTQDETLASDCAYYIAYAAVKLNQPNADVLMQEFIKTYPVSIKRNDASFNIANYYFDSAQYRKAAEWYQQIDEYTLSEEELERYNFNLGYTYFKADRKSEAQRHLKRVVGSEAYGSQANYYLGFIAYEGDDYQQAQELFERLESDTDFAQDVSYYQADMSFKSGDFRKALELGLEQFPTADRSDKSEVAKIIGESYFNLGQYNEAIPYLKQYKGKAGKWNNTDYYQLGYAYYKQGEYQNAVNEFNKIIGGKDAIAQNAFYHLAESYLKLNQKQQALNAFKNASEMNFSAEIQEDAWFNYAKLSYDIGNSYQSVPSVILSFMEKYPSNPNSDMLEDLLIDSYVSSRNYEEAMDLLEKNKKFENKLAYQKVAFLRGVELFDQNKFTDALRHFDKSLAEPRDREITARATYWKAETDYQLGKYAEALIGFKQYEQLPGAGQTPEYALKDYPLAYVEYHLDNYEQAISHFNKFVNKANLPQDMAADAHLRLADSYFMTSKYWPAMEQYNEAIAKGNANRAYAEFQKAISYGFVDREAQKIEALQDFIVKYPKTNYYADALYELGNTYVNRDENQKAMQQYDKLINEVPNSRFAPITLLKKSLLLTNQGNNTEALNVLHKVAADYPATPEAMQAVKSAEMIYIDQGRVDAYAAWAQTLEFVEVKDVELDHATFQSAETPYIENNTQLAESRLKEYLNSFPKGIHATQANFYLGQIYYAADNKNQAIKYYKEVADMPTNEFSEPALARLTESYLSNENYGEAVAYLQKLEEVATHEENMIFAKTNSMKSYYELEDYAKAVAYATDVLAISGINDRVKNDAYIIEARSAMKTNNEVKAEQAYKEVAKTATGITAAEALYYDAYFKNKHGEYEASNQQVQVLAKDYSGYKEFGGRGLILMAQNFYALKDAYQATYILQSVEDNFTDYPEIVREAKAIHKNIKEEEAKTNASVNE